MTGTLTFSHCTAAATVGSAAVRFAVHPYGKDTVPYEGITAGMTIGQQN